ncbi:MULTISPECIES: hypothetical protein [unclassified Borrelia]|uniref:hypothetical protein n=1 Tax=unclassified Borrelia TaxID=2649934 RepID=UPI001E59DE00|nr:MULTISPECIES: hypothetical protein [unclassified Borrelia]UGQ16675.1 hypothetical protein LSO06_04990 [Borrelia sp. RT5S]UGQ17833.1 hypothetical protein LSO05_05225 [Borrelia sp. RT1S]
MSSKNNFNISFNNPLYRERLIADKYFDNPYLDVIDGLFLRTPVNQKGGTLALYAMQDKQESSELASFSSDPKQLKDGLAKSTFLLTGYSLERTFGDIDYRDEEAIKQAEKIVMQNLAEVVHRDYLLKGMNELHTKSTPVEVKSTDDFISKLKEARSKMSLQPNRIAMTAKTAGAIIATDKGIQKRMEIYRIPEFDEAALLKVALGIEPFIFQLPEDSIYDGYIYLLHYARSTDVYSKSVGLRNFLYDGTKSDNYERARFCNGQFARRYYQERGGINGQHYAQFSLIGQLKVENPNLISVLKLTDAKTLPKNYPSS